MKSPYSSNVFFFESRSPFVFLFVIFMSYIWSLFTFWVTKFSAILADADIRGSFFVSALETVIWFLLDSLHIFYQLLHMVSWLIHHIFAVSIWSSLQMSECEVMLHDAPLSIWHSMTCLLLFVFISIGATHAIASFFFNICNFLCNNVCWLIVGWLF